MDTLLFFLMFAGAWLVLGWYVHNEARGAGGGIGLLAIRVETRAGRENGAAAYRVRARRARSSLSNLPDADGSSRYRAASDGAAYRVVDRAAYNERGAAYREKVRAKDSA